MSSAALGAEQIEHFVNRGYVVLRQVIPPTMVAEWAEWFEQRVMGWQQAHGRPLPAILRMAPILRLDVRQVAPKIWEAGCELLGGAERVAETVEMTDGFIINSPSLPPEVSFEEGCSVWTAPKRESREWHIDGDWFRHFLDSPEWNLTALFSWTESKSKCGATLVAPGSHFLISRYLLAHPEGIDRYNLGELLDEEFEWTEVEMKPGDVVFLHPHLLHCSSQNVGRMRRAISTCMFDSKAPLRLDADAGPSPVERAILRGVGMTSVRFERTREAAYAKSRRASEYEETLQAERAALRELLV